MGSAAVKTTNAAPPREPAQAVKGVSLGQDAWRRLRKNRIAMLCLWTLITIGLLAFFTPLLPLQPPDHIATQLQYMPPQLSPFWEKSFALDLSEAQEQAELTELLNVKYA